LIPSYRERFNAEFTEERHRAFVETFEARAGTHLSFPISETPCFLPASLMDRLVTEAHVILDQLFENPDYMHAAAGVVPPELRLASGETWPTCIQVDFGLVQTDDGDIEGRLVELQAFPSLYGLQMLLAETAQQHYGFEELTPFIGGISREEYLEHVRQAIVGDHDPNEVVLVEIDPQHQKTLPDFMVTERLWGVRAVDLSTLLREGRRLFVRGAGGLTPVRRIYNRVIPDELMHKGLAYPFDLREQLDVEWVGGPDWYFRLSKFAIPWIDHPWVPKTYYLHETPSPPGDRNGWLLKPLFSFAGGGIIFAPTDEQIEAIPAESRRHYILQERLHFTPVIATPHGPTQVEIRIMMVRDGDVYRALIPLLRMGRGKMIGVDHNKGFKWVGASGALIDQAS
jgi:hypothetical protein